MRGINSHGGKGGVSAPFQITEKRAYRVHSVYDGLKQKRVIRLA